MAFMEPASGFMVHDKAAHGSESRIATEGSLIKQGLATMG